MNNKLLKLALLGLGIGVAGGARADLAGGMAALEAGRCAQAIKALTPDAQAGKAAAQKALGDAYTNARGRCDDRRGSKADDAEGERWYLSAARVGDVGAQRELYFLYGVSAGSRNPEQATFWMGKVAALGGAADLSKLATRYEQAEGVPHDRVLAHTFELLASRGADKDDKNDKNGKDEKGGRAKRLARNVSEMSPEQLAEAERLAAAWKPGTPLPTASETGRRDPREWYQAAAQAGDLDAAHKAGTLYWKFVYGLKIDYVQAAFWLRKAAQGGVAEAQYELSRLYAHGEGVPKDFVLAYALERLALKGGSQAAAKTPDTWDDALTAQQLEEGKALLAAWRKGDAFPGATRYGLQRKVNYVDEPQGKREAPPQVLALFKAANEGDEAEFGRLLAQVDNVNDYLVDEGKLLHALLRPAESLSKEGWAWKEARKNARDTAHWQQQQARHAALAPAKTRMLALALQRGAGVNEGTLRENAAPLHLAAMFGTPEMVRLLLKHGADPRQYGGIYRNEAPLEFALAQSEYALGLPELISPAQRTANIMALVEAGSLRPYIRVDIADAKKTGDEPKLKRPVADYLLWPRLVALTSGTAVLDALLATGTRPAEDDDGKSVFDNAAEAGNADAIGWLKPRVPRYDGKKQDRWLNAAMLAMYSSAPGRDKVLQQLLVKDMDWSVTGPQTESFHRDYRTLFGGSERVVAGTLLHHATRARRTEWIGKLAELGTPVRRGGSGRDLLAAVLVGDAGPVKTLLEQGADPVAEVQSSLSEDSAIAAALRAPPGQDQMLDLLLDHLARVDKKALARLTPSPLEALLTGKGTIDTARLRKLLDAGASARGLDARAVGVAFAAPERDVATLLINHGLLDKPAAAETGQGDGRSRFVDAAIYAGRADLLPALLAQGVDPNQRVTLAGGREQPSSVEYAISQGQLEALNVLLAFGGVIDTTGGHAWGSALDLSVASLDPAMLRAVTKNHAHSLKQVCLPSARQLEKVVLRSSASYWTLLREHGFGQGDACGGMQQRLALHLSTADVLLAGWPGQHLVERLPQLAARPERFDAETWAAITASKNEVLPSLLARAGWKSATPAPANAEQAEKP
ncbi:TPR repeat [Duganella sp. CF517]|uniref:hypothetical protein n=1 Tax=Duganella sp. CF517 TaxID=1881038 RepID=UPI0008C7CE30|nr:hypothetical protein [Duganella sp. CF517]SEN52996.1 TPR repeat [Duganella sp. CF517]